MAASTITLSPANASPFQRWYSHFLDHRDDIRSLRTLPWDDPYVLSETERQLVAASIQQFQLGEWARGRGLARRANAHPVLGHDPWFTSVLDLFITEEQGHSRMLARFLDRENIPRIAHEWADTIFRKLRKLAGIELCVMVLVTAEVLAVPFYQALRDATRSRLLGAICRLILCDEAAHLLYQALTLGILRRPLTRTGRRVHGFLHATLFRGTALLLWRQHRRVFRAAGWGFRRFWDASNREFGRLERRIQQITAAARFDAAEPLRLD